MFNYLTPLTYWLLVIIWSAILWFCVKRLRHRKIESAFFATILVILTIDAFRTLFESLYFGAWYTSRAGLLPSWVFNFLVRPEMVIIPKVINLVAAVWVALLLRQKWLPQEEEERLKIEEYVEKLETQAQKQQQTEKALRESEERFRNIVESSPMGMHMYELRKNGDLILTGANPAASAILGINHDDFVGKTIEEAFPTLKFTEVPDRYRDICAFGKPWQTEDILYKDGAISGAFQVHAFQTLPGRMASQFMDITERKQTEEALSMTQFTLDHAAISVLWIRQDGTFTYINNAASDLFGYSREKLLSMRISDLTPDSDMREMIWNKIKSTRSMTFEINILRKDNSLVPVEITSHYIQFGKQEFEFAFVVDRTRRKQAEKELAELNKNLEKLIVARTHDLEHKAVELEEANIRLTEVDRLKSALLSSVTHELKTPLTSIIGYTKLTSRDFERDFLPMVSGNTSLAHRGKRIRDNLTVIGHEGARLLGLIDNFLALSRVKSGINAGQKQPLNMEEVIQRAARLSQSYFATQPDITLEMDIEKDLPTVHADPDNIVQVIVNLLDNAAKFATSGIVRLRSNTTGTGFLRITISDDGPGIPEGERDKIFEPFHQVCEDADCTIKPPGAGTGLSICKHIVEHYGGKIWLECPDAGGSEFIVELPVENSPANG